MALYKANLMIRESRMAQGLTQEQLAEGICSRETIVKLEKGERKPNWFVFREILLRLGLNPEIYQDEIVSTNDIYVLKKWNECDRLLTARKLDKVKAELDSIEAEKNSSAGKVWQSGLGYWALLSVKASFYSIDSLEGNQYKNPELAIKYSLESLRIARPDFEIEKIPDYYLATHEYQLLNSLALAYGELEGEHKAIELWRKLKANMEKNYSVSVRDASNEWYRNLLCNITVMLLKTELYEECLQSAEESLVIAQATQSIFHYQNALGAKAFCLLKLGRKDEGEELYKKFMLFRYAIDGYPGLDFDSTKEWYEANFGGQLNLSVPW